MITESSNSPIYSFSNPVDKFTRESSLFSRNAATNSIKNQADREELDKIKNRLASNIKSIEKKSKTPRKENLDANLNEKREKHKNTVIYAQPMLERQSLAQEDQTKSTQKQKILSQIQNKLNALKQDESFFNVSEVQYVPVKQRISANIMKAKKQTNLSRLLTGIRKDIYDQQPSVELLRLNHAQLLQIPVFSQNVDKNKYSNLIKLMNDLNQTKQTVIDLRANFQPKLQTRMNSSKSYHKMHESKLSERSFSQESKYKYLNYRDRNNKSTSRLLEDKILFKLTHTKGLSNVFNENPNLVESRVEDRIKSQNSLISKSKSTHQLSFQSKFAYIKANDKKI